MVLHSLCESRWFFLANDFYTGPFNGVACVLSMFGHSRLKIADLHRIPVFIWPSSQFHLAHYKTLKNLLVLKDISLQYVPTAESSLCHFFKTFSLSDIRYVPHTNVHQRKTRTLPAGKCCPNHTISQAYCRPYFLASLGSEHRKTDTHIGHQNSLDGKYFQFDDSNGGNKTIS